MNCTHRNCDVLVIVMDNGNKLLQLGRLLGGPRLDTMVDIK